MKYTIDDLLEAVKAGAKIRADNAAYSGSMHDGGSGALLNHAKYYEMGMNGEYPKEWEAYKHHIDPDYEEYLRLKNKFNR